jgi:hypothetical protein
MANKESDENIQGTFEVETDESGSQTGCFSTGRELQNRNSA